MPSMMFQRKRCGFLWEKKRGNFGQRVPPLLKMSEVLGRRWIAFDKVTKERFATSGTDGFKKKLGSQLFFSVVAMMNDS